MSFRPSSPVLVRHVYARRNPASAADIQAAYGISSSFANKIVEVSNRIGLPDPAFLANVINFESKFDPKIRNPISGATGLIQFMPKTTAPELGTTADALAAMTAEQQMEYVYKYFTLPRIKQYGPLKTQEDVYMAVFYPVAIGKPDYVFPLKVQAQNYGFKTPKDYTAWANARAKMATTVISALTTVGVSGEAARTVVRGASSALWISAAVSVSILGIVGALAVRRALR